MPLIVCVAKLTGWPLRAIACSAPVGPLAGSIAWSPVAPAPWATLKLRRPPLKASPWKDDALRPSSHVSIWRAETTGTPRACAAAMIASAPGLSARRCACWP